MSLTRKKLGKELLTITENVFGHSVDATLALLAYLAAMSVSTLQRNPDLHARIASEKFLEQINYEAIKNALITAWKRQYILKYRHALPEITQEGKQRLSELLPVYDAIRVWDMRLHAITYDVPEKQKSVRDALRRFLIRVRCAKLQESVWITPYNPIDLLRTFVKEKGISGTVIVSDLGKDAAIGEESFSDLVARLFNLKEINTRYETWLDEYKNERPLSIGYQGLMQYLAILKSDPQLPFDLLPKWWKGDTAYQKIKPLYEKVLLAARPRR